MVDRSEQFFSLLVYPYNVGVCPLVCLFHNQPGSRGLLVRLVIMYGKDPHHLQEQRPGAGAGEDGGLNVGGLDQDPLHNDVRYEEVGVLEEEVGRAGDGPALVLLTNERNDEMNNCMQRDRCTYACRLVGYVYLPRRLS